MSGSIQIAISAGEPSGDEYAAALARALLELEPSASIFGMGGRNLRAAGADIVVDCEKTGAVMGFSEVVWSLKKVLDSFNALRAELAKRKPNILVVIDYAEFNMRLAAAAKQLGIKVVYFITPQVWAWRSSRISKMRKYLDAAVVLFPFEKEFLNLHSFKNAYFFGHPLTQSIITFDPKTERAKVCNEFNIQSENNIVLILPGSRRAEIKKNLAIMLQGFQRYREQDLTAHAIVVAASSLPSELFAGTSSNYIHLVHGDATRYMQVADAAVLKSGTSNLQAALCALPFVMFYRTSLITEMIVRLVTKRREFSIVNILRSNTVRELCQTEANAENIANELHRLISDKSHRDTMKRNFKLIAESLRTQESESDSSNISKSVAKLVLETAAA